MKRGLYYAAFLVIVLAAWGCGNKLSAPTASGTAPYDVSLSRQTDGQMRLSWSYAYSPGDTITYTVSRKVGEESWNVSYGTTTLRYFTDVIPPADTLVYMYKVRAYSAYNETTTPDGPLVAYLSPSTAPYNLATTQINENSVRVQWDSRAVGHDGFYVDKKKGDGNWLVHYKSIPYGSLSFVDNVELFVPVTYRVYTYAGTSRSDYANITMTPTMTSPNNLVVDKPDMNNLRLTWSDNSKGENGFYIDRRVGEQDWVNNYAIADSNATSYVDPVSFPCATVTYRVRAYHGEFVSAYTNEASANVRMDVVGFSGTIGRALDVEAMGWYGIVANEFNGLVMMELDNPAAILQYTAAIIPPDRTLSVTSKGTVGYFTSYSDNANRGLLQSFNVSTNGIMTVNGSSIYTSGIPYDVISNGSYAFIADGPAGLTVAALTSAGVPTSSATYTSGGTARKLALNGDWLYVANGIDGVAVFNISNPLSPIYYTTLDTRNNAVDLAVENNRLFVAAGGGGLLEYDLANPGSPYFRQQIMTGGFLNGIAALDNYVYGTDVDKGLVVFNTTTTGQAFIQGKAELDYPPLSLRIFHSYVLICSEDGLSVVQVKP